MKIRSGFVSNSSSSSFVLKYDTNDFKKCEYYGSQPVTPLDMVELDNNIYEDTTKVLFRDIESIIDYFNKEIESYTYYDSDPPDCYVNIINKLKSLKLKPTEEVISVKIGYDSMTEKNICEMLDKGLVEHIKVYNT